MKIGWKDERFWPTFPKPFHESSEEDPEIKREIQVHLLAFPGTTLNSMIQRYSSWYKLKRGVAWLICFKEFIKNEFYSRRALSNLLDACLLPKKLSLEEIRTAEVELIKYVQRVSFPQVLYAQKRSSSLVRQKHALRCSGSSDSIYKLWPWLDQRGILRVGGRLEYVSINFKA